ncbi:hypothetical protein MTR67_017900 [Solanum verrucosum]|uniref:Uncharacterized protein n=1 Tax=Solanum verrucosum TaxID=315347 RepID=A0AAF0QLE2_SOLVR|nr:hypothetical protein MTR67_017900 [Solanum verrucosum]
MREGVTEENNSRTQFRCIIAFMKLTLTDISSIFVDGRSGESIQLDVAYLDVVLVPRSEGKDLDIRDSESDRTLLRLNGYRSWPDERRVELILALT